MAAGYTTPGWADLPLDLVDGVITRLPFPGDRARFAGVCRAWRYAVRQVASNLPWIVLPYGFFCTTVSPDDDVDDEDTGLFFQIPGLPKNATCLGAAGDAWLALDCTDFALRRSRLCDMYCPDKKNYNNDPRPDVKHSHVYMLYNPFSNTTVPLPELDAIIGNVAETFEIRKVLMRSSSSAAADDVIAVTTNNSKYNVILCRPGKGTFVVPYCRVIDIVFLGDVLYGITSGEELLAFHLGEDKDGGRPNVSNRFEVAIRNPAANYYKEDWWTWPQDNGHDEDQHSNGGEVYEEDQELNDDKEEPNNQEADSDDGSAEEEEDQELNDDKEEPNNQEADSDDGSAEEDDSNEKPDDDVSDNERRVGFDEEVPYEPKDEIYMGRYLVKSQSGELLLVRHQHQSSPYFDSYTRKVEVLKADLDMGKWDASDGLTKGEALFLSRSFSKCTRACGDIQDGFVYCVAHLEDIFDMTSQTTRDIILWPWQCRQGQHRLLTWLFPPEIVV